MADKIPYTALPSGEEVEGKPEPESNAPRAIQREPVAAAPAVILGVGLPAVQEVFQPSTMLAWDMLEKRMKVWFILSIANLVAAFFIRYQIYSSILGVIGSSIYLFKSFQGGALGITHSRVNNLTALSLVATIAGSISGVVLFVFMTVMIYLGEHFITFWFAGYLFLQLGHVAASMMVYRKVRDLNHILRMEATQVEML